ncbi:MAG: hypothetical protein VX444_05690 [Pseudomonadota bacterium]|nr:hypothetical protein [Pseudomonadota bacterium]
MSLDLSVSTQPRVTRAECDAALAHVLTAPKDNVPVEMICFRSGYSERSFPDRLELSKELGIVGERWLKDAWLKLPDGRPDPRIQVSILPKRVMDLCWRDRENTIHPGDPFIADLDTSEANLTAGTHLAIGSAVIEVTGFFNTACVKWRDRYGAESLAWLNDPANKTYRLRGLFCRIVEDGEVRLGDLIRKLPD